MDENYPLVSIIVRTKDRPKLLRTALQSIAVQTYRPIEVVLVNDGGCDLDAEELKAILGDISLNYIRLEKNTGRAHAGNVGIENAKGEYIGFLDDDDEFYPEHVGTLALFLMQSDYNVAYTDSLMVYKEYKSQTQELSDIRKELRFSLDFDYSYLIFENFIPFMCLLFRREILVSSGGFDANFDLYEDWDLLIRLGEKYPFYHIMKITANYNQWDSSMQISQWNRDFNFIEQSYLRVLSKHFDKVNEKRIRNYISHFVRTRDTLLEINKGSTWLESELKEKDEKIEKYKHRIQNLETALKEKNMHIENLDVANRGKEATLNRIYSSHGWKALRIYYKIRDRLFPLNSERRLLAKVFLIAAENPKGLVKNLSKNNIRKFFLQYKTLDPSTLESKVRIKTLSRFIGKDSASDAVFLNGATSFDDKWETPHMEEKNRVLVIDRWVPTYDKDSGSLRMYSLLAILSDLGYKVTFFPDDLRKTEPYASELQKIGIEVLDENIDAEKYLKRVGHIFSFVILSRPEQAYKYIPLIRAYAINSVVIYDTVDIHWLRFERSASVTGDKNFITQAKHYKPLELFSASCSDIVFAITEDEKEILLKEIPELAIKIVPNIHEVVWSNVPFRARKDLMFVGGFQHQPNEDAVIYFVKKIFPLIKERIEGIKFFIVGSNPSNSILKLSSKDIIVTGYVKNLAQHFESCRVFVSPLRYGAGMKGKIGQSMSYGLPVVTTTIGAEGIGLVDGSTALISDDPRMFAEAAIKLYTDESLWNKISEESMKHIQKNYSKEAISNTVGRLFNDIKESKYALSSEMR